MRSHVILFLAALVLNVAFSFAMGPKAPMESDAFYYKQIAVSLAEGEGFRFREGFWPDAPTMSRMPGWPAAVAVVLRAVPGNPDVLMRGLALLLNALSAVLVAVLTRRVIHRPGAGVLGAAVYALHPTALSCAYEGLSEPLFVLLAVGGTLLVLRAWQRDQGRMPVISIVLGSLLLGTAALVRANFLLLIFFVGGLLGLWVLRQRGRGVTLARLAMAAAAAVIFVLPPVGWALRNQPLCGHFPVLSTLRGQTFYGGNNPVVAQMSHYWGYWIFPNSIPGEPTMYDLSRTMTEYEVDKYYYTRGVAFLREHPEEVASLMLGKLVRGFVPVPWVWRPTSLALAGFRWLLYLATLAGLLVSWRRTAPGLRLIIAAMVLTTVSSTLLFYGSARFTFALEPFMVPFAVAGVIAMKWAGIVLDRLAPLNPGRQCLRSPIPDR